MTWVNRIAIPDVGGVLRWHRKCRAAALAFGCLVMMSLLLSGATITAAADRAPNIVFILADDLGWGELGSYGQQKIPTPHLDRLAQDGMRFTQHYSGAPVCAPSRCVLMTGKHLGNAEVRNNQNARVKFPQFEEGQHPLTPQAVTIAQVLQKAGYVTGAMGKWGLGPVGSTGEPNQKGFDLFFGYNCQGVAHSFYPYALWKNREQIVINPKPIPGHAKQPDGDVKLEDWIGETYAPHRIVATAEAFLDEHHARPFFLYLPFTEPHVAIHPPKSSVERFPREWDDEVYRGECGYLPHPRPRAGYAAMISDLDSYVGRILKKLDDHQVADRTLVIFTSDNGATHPRPQSDHFHVGGVDAGFFNSTAGLRGYKGSVYEGGIRVPMLARFPGKIAPQTVSDFPSYFADWFPTLCDVAGIDTPAGLDGVSLWPILQGTEAARSQPLVWVFPGYQGQVAVRMGNWKVVRQRLATRQPGAWELYDLQQDPGETQDLASDHPDFIAEAIAILNREVAENTEFPLAIPGVTPRPTR